MSWDLQLKCVIFSSSLGLTEVNGYRVIWYHPFDLTSWQKLLCLSVLILKVCLHKSESLPRKWNPPWEFSLHTNERNSSSWRWCLGHCGVRSAIRGESIENSSIQSSYLILHQHHYVFRAEKILLTNDVLVALISQGGDVISTILRREFTYDQRQGTCAEVRGQLSQHPLT